jgi:hypothetical protein
MVNTSSVNTSSSSPVMTNIVIKENVASGHGGGMNNYSSSPVLSNAVITRNSANGYGGGIRFAYYSSPSLIDVAVTENTAETGGGIAVATSTSYMTNIVIAGNSAVNGDGGGMRIDASAGNDGSWVILINAAVTGNFAGTNGGGIANGSSLICVNATIAGNTAAKGGGIYNRSRTSDQLRILNSIIWGNTSGIDVVYNNTEEISYSIVQDEWTGAGVSNRNSDPAFALTAPAAPSAGGDYSLESASPAINAGHNDYYPDSFAKWKSKFGAINENLYNTHCSALVKDLGGANRIKGDVIDMGAYEEPGGVTLPFITLTITDQGNGLFSQGTFTVSKTGTGGYSTTQTVTLITGAGYTNPRWFVDGVEKGPANSNSITIDALDYLPGGHSLSLWAEKDGVPWSKDINFSVAQ